MLSSSSPTLHLESSSPTLWHEPQQNAWLPAIDPLLLKPEEDHNPPPVATADLFPSNPDWPPTDHAAVQAQNEIKVNAAAAAAVVNTAAASQQGSATSSDAAGGGIHMQASSPTSSSSTELFHRVPLGEKGRMELKSAIRAAIKERPELRERVNAVAKLRCATIPQLLKIASICNLWTMALNISRRFMETRNGKQARSNRRDAAGLVTPNAADLRRVRPNPSSSKVRRPNVPLHESGPSASPASASCPVSSPLNPGQQGDWDAGACWTAYDAVQSWISTPSWTSSVPYSLADLGGTAAPPPGPDLADLAFPAWNMTSY